MADTVITLKDQKFRKVKGIWVDQKKTPAPKDLIGLLDKLSDAEAASAKPEEAKEVKPALPVVPSAAKDSSIAKLESSINRLAKIIENLSKTIEKGTKGADGTSKAETTAQRIYEPVKTPTLREVIASKISNFFNPDKNKYATPSVTKETAKEVARMKAENPELTSAKALEQIRARSTKTEAVNIKNTSNTNKIPTFAEALKLNTKDFLMGTTNKYGEKQTPGLLRTIAEKSLPVIGPTIFAARDRQRAAMAEQIKENGTPGEKEREKTNRKSESEFASPELDKKIIAVKITEIDDSVLKKLSEIFGKKDDKVSSEDKEEDKPKTADNKGGGLRDKIKKIRDMFKRKSPKGAAAAVEKEAEQLLDKNGKPLRGAAKASREAKLAKEAAESAEQVAKKPSILSRILGGGAKTVEQATEQVAKKPSILSRIFGGGTKAAAGTGAKVAEKVAAKGSAKLLGRLGAGFVPGVGGALDIAAAANAAKEGNPLAAALYGSAGALNIGGAAADVTGVGAIGGLPADIIGGVLTAGGMAAEFTGFGKTKPKPAMIKPAGVTPQTQVLTATTKRVEAAKEQKATAAPTVINNNVSSPMNISSSQGVIGGPTVADRGSLNLASF
jgi:hypothetical protein